MGTATKAIETTGIIDARRLILDEQLPVSGPTRACVILLLQEVGRHWRRGMASSRFDKPGV